MSQLKDLVRKEGDLYFPLREIEPVLHQTSSLFVDVRRMVVYTPQEFEQLPSGNGTLLRVKYPLHMDDVVDARYHVERHLADFYIGTGSLGGDLESRKRNVFDLVELADIPPEFKKLWYEYHDNMRAFDLDYDLLASNTSYGDINLLTGRSSTGWKDRVRTYKNNSG